MNAVSTRISALVLTLALLALAACAGEQGGANLIVTNESGAAVSLVGVSTDERSEAVSNADGSPIGAGAAVSFRMPESTDCRFTVEVYDMEEALIAQKEFTRSFFANEQEEEVRLSIKTTENGTVTLADTEPEQINRGDPSSERIADGDAPALAFTM